MHEATLKVGRGIAQYLDSLLKLVERNKLADRVHFMGAVSDDDLLPGMKLCDAVIMPYINSGQSASGPANQAVELDRPSYFTRSIQFLEMEKYLPGAFQFFEIGNHIELAQKIKLGPKGKDRNVSGLRFVEFPRIHGRTSVVNAVANYIAAANGSSSSYRCKNRSLTWRRCQPRLFYGARRQACCYRQALPPPQPDKGYDGQPDEQVEA